MHILFIFLSFIAASVNHQRYSRLSLKMDANDMSKYNINTTNNLIYFKMNPLLQMEEEIDIPIHIKIVLVQMNKLDLRSELISKDFNDVKSRISQQKTFSMKMEEQAVQMIQECTNKTKDVLMINIKIKEIIKNFNEMANFKKTIPPLSPGHIDLNPIKKIIGKIEFYCEASKYFLDFFKVKITVEERLNLDYIHTELSKYQNVYDYLNNAIQLLISLIPQKEESIESIKLKYEKLEMIIQGLINYFKAVGKSKGLNDEQKKHNTFLFFLINEVRYKKDELKNLPKNKNLVSLKEFYLEMEEEVDTLINEIYSKKPSNSKRERSSSLLCMM
ncbi:hypothetical protein TCON_2213 [Astathelohania contejeani]|uniref:Uncharacterized protein n=1 Tax=Astathelohania contejeani TaxID=164912 RepID=A0ABQ7HWR6_9MICR|nr:hypothetical protein TCON_2213 [Thelohania contejeani]